MTSKVKLAFGMVFLLWLIHFSIYNHFTWGALLIFLLPFALALGLRVFFTQLFSYHLVLVLFFSSECHQRDEVFFHAKSFDSAGPVLFKASICSSWLFADGESNYYWLGSFKSVYPL